MKIRPAARADLPAIAAIQSVSPASPDWNPLDYDCSVAERGGEVCGFLVTREIARGECEILNLAVLPSQRRSGIAKLLVGNVLKSTGGTWHLEVRESNTPAISLYRALGFRVAGRRENYYNNPAEAAIVMSFFS
jgi:ribosomal protein S18 acetylase RimI-like enzyme